jgi:hypothetical protein
MQMDARDPANSANRPIDRCHNAYKNAFHNRFAADFLVVDKHCAVNGNIFFAFDSKRPVVAAEIDTETA